MTVLGYVDGSGDNRYLVRDAVFVVCADFIFIVVGLFVNSVQTSNKCGYPS